MLDIFKLFGNIRVYRKSDHVFLHKPLLVLVALGCCYRKKPRLLSYLFWDEELSKLFDHFYSEGLVYNNTFYPFGRLESDQIWEVQDSALLTRTSAGHLLKAELISKNIHGGFIEPVYSFLISNPNANFEIAKSLLSEYFSLEKHDAILQAVGIKHESPVQPDLYPQPSSGSKVMQSSSYIAYLNSLHNASASNPNALAESQALQQHFIELYKPFPVAASLFEKIKKSKDSVIILTGHAGDGKSTIALDIIKRLRNIPHKLDKPLAEKELCFLPDDRRSIHIVKDMSELSLEKRQAWLNQAFDGDGSWLIISNTGPMLNALIAHAKSEELDIHIENEALRVLDEVYHNGSFENLTISGFSKPLIIVNVARLDNTELGAELLKNMLNHSGWNECESCSAKALCPLKRNRQALLEAGDYVTDRVRWVYQRLTAYEQRLTLRQMVGHLSLSLTGNINCQEAQQYASEQQVDSGLGWILFSETFFGYQLGEKSKLITGIKAAELLQDMALGGNIAADFERRLIREVDKRSYTLSPSLQALEKQWVTKAQGERDGINWRYALRRIAYIYGQPSPNAEYEPKFDDFLNQFLQSAHLRDLDNWNRKGWSVLNYSDRQENIRSILSVLLELYSGFNNSQFKSQPSLYLTMRRTNKDVVQTTQLVIAVLPYERFSIKFDPIMGLPKLIYKSREDVSLTLTLPLLDFIRLRNVGNFGTSLSPIHLANLEWFRSKLLSCEDSDGDSEDISLLKVGVKGDVSIKKYHIDEVRNELVSSL